VHKCYEKRKTFSCHDETDSVVAAAAAAAVGGVTVCHVVDIVFTDGPTLEVVSTILHVCVCVCVCVRARARASVPPALS